MRRGLQFKLGKQKRFHFNQTIVHHIDMAKEELTKIDKGSVNPATAKLLETVQEELNKGSKETSTCQKKIRIADRSKFS